MNDYSLTAALTAAVCASTDTARPVLGQVVAVDSDTFVATDSYQLVVAHDNRAETMTPGVAVAHAMAVGQASRKADTSLPMIPATALVAYGKRVKVGTHTLTSSDDGRYATLTNNADGLTPGSMVETVTFEACVADYPGFGQLLSGSRPVFDYGNDIRPAFCAEFMARFAKMSKVASGKSKKSGSTQDYAWTFQGGAEGSVLKPMYWSANAGAITIVVLQMPVRTDGNAW